VFVSQRRDAKAARRFFQKAIAETKVTPAEVVTDKAATYPVALDELLPAAWHCTNQYANNPGDAVAGGRRVSPTSRWGAWFRERAVGSTKVTPSEVVTDKAATYPMVLDELLPAVWHRTDQYANSRLEADHGRLKALRPMRGLKQDRSTRVIIAGHAFIQNLRRGHYELAVEAPVGPRVTVAFDDLALAI
jgi:transposase-like protein